MKLKNLIISLVSIAILTAAGSTFAAEKTLEILAPWQGSGQIFKIAPEEAKVVGTFQGIMYISSKEDTSLDAALFQCPSVQRINLTDQSMSIEGDCVIVKGENKLAYAKFTCEGKIGTCTGLFTLTGGEGDFAGISGQGEMMIRTTFGARAADMKTGEMITAGVGLAMWRDFKVSLPE
jgi:hypothetical protein